MALHTATAYPLSPAQQGMLFHALHSARRSVYFQQCCYTLRGAPDDTAFRRAWDRVVERHAVLRTRFIWEGVDQPMQVVAERATLPLTSLDWSAQSAEEQAARLETFLAEDRDTPFDLLEPPLARGTLIRLSRDRFCFVWSHHHLVLDGWSNLVLLQEVAAQYEAIRRGADLQLLEPRPYSDYIEWLERHDWRASEPYWRDRLEGLTTPTPLPLEAPAPSDAAPRREKQSARVAEDVWTRLTALAREQRVTPGTIVQGCWALLLARYSRRHTVLFGTTVSGRPATLQGSDTMVGLFIDVVPTLVRVDPTVGLFPWLRSVQREQAMAREFQHTPLVEIQGWSEIPRGMPLFDSLVSFENYPLDVFAQSHGADAEASNVPIQIESLRIAEHSNFPLTLIAVPSDTLLLTLSYDADRFAAGAIDRVLQQLRCGLEAIAARPEALTSDLAFAPARRPERRAVTANAVPAPCFHEQFSRCARTHPDTIVLAYGDERISYRGLDERTNQLAAALERAGVLPETRVAVCTRRTPRLVLGMLGVLKAGGVYVPLDPQLPTARLARLLDHAQPAVVLTDGESYGRLPSTFAETIDLDGDWSGVDAERFEAPERRPPTGANLAYLIYTSGSTGRPKGVGVEHANLSSYVRGVSARIGFDGGRFALVSTPAADLGHTCLFPALLGGELHLVDESTVTDGARLAEYAERHGLEYLKITPSHLAALLAAGEPQRMLPARALILGGERSTCAWVGELLRARPGCEVWNHYGPTECTVGALARRVTPDLIEQQRLVHVPLGQPFDGTDVHVVDAEGHLAPLGAPGELWIGGAGVARGYFNQPALTAEQFVPDPFGRAGRRAYRTGDRARVRQDGELEFLGRVDHQVKLRGYRIELGEIEATLSVLPSVRHCAAELRETAGGEPLIVAYLLPVDGAVDVDTCRRALEEQLPAHMVPAAFVVLDRWPLLPNGKLDRSALPDPEPPRPTASADRAATPLEDIVAGVWCDVLHLDHVGLGDDFFVLGGHSLLATQLVARIRAVLQVELSVRSVFERPTVAGLAAEVAAMRRGAAHAQAPPIGRVESTEETPLSFAQQRLWFIDQLQPGQATYNVPKAVRLTGALNLPALRAALSEVVRRHEVLRTCFPARSGQPMQVVSPAAPVPVPVVDLRGCDPRAREAVALGLAMAEARRPFDLARGPLLRARFLRLGRQDHVLLLTLHHIVCDGWSIGILIRELMALYHAASEGAASPLPELPIQYRDFSTWQRAWLCGAVLDEQLQYWTGQLEGVDALELSADRPRHPMMSDRGGRLRWTMPPGLAAQVRMISQREGATRFMTLLAAFQVALGRLAGQTDFAVGTDVANRTHVETEGLVGFLVNQLVLRAQLAGDPPFAQLLAQVRETTLGAYTHQDLPFERLVEELAPVRHSSRAPLFQVKLVLQNAPRVAAALPGIAIESFGLGPEAAKFDLTLVLDDDDGEVSGTLEYTAALYSEATARRILEAYERLLAHAMRQPACRLSQLTLLSESERHQLVVDWNATAAPSCTAVTAHAAVIAHAQRRGDAVAAICGNAHLTFAALNARANQLAHHLRTFGIGPEVIVGLSLPRGLDLAVGMLGILKAGGAYLPLDPGYPAARIAAMLEDAHVSILVTDTSASATLPASWALHVYIDRDAGEISAQPSSEPPSVDTPAALAYVMYTSGSTGRAKGVMVTHGAVSNLARAQVEGFGITPASAVLQFASFSFDAATSEWSTAWLAGARLVFASPEDLLPGPSLLDLIERHGIDVVTWPPSLAAVLPTAAPPRTLRTLVLAGEASSGEVVARWAGGGCRVLNAYGPTEGTVCATMSTALPGGAAPPPIGRPIANVQVYVVDASGELSPLSAAGEMYIGGAGVTRGYLNQPALTAASFVPDPFGSTPGARRYRTGDRVRWRGDGQLEFLRRHDQQIKLRGHRIEPGDVEAALASHPAVRHCAVGLVGDGDDEPRLVAYVVPADPAPTWDALRRHLHERLPDFMLPQALVLLDRLPVTRSGKLDRRALPVPAPSAIARSPQASARTPIEQIVTGIWSEVLRHDAVGRDDDFFALGGHSLLAAQVVARLRDALGVELPLRALFEHPTLRGLAARVTQAREAVAGVELPAITPAARPPEVPLSHAQRRLWFLNELTPGRATYNLPYAVRLRGPLNLQAVARALTAIVERHEVLRTTFEVRGGEPAQRIHPAEPVPVPLVDVPDEALARRLAAAEARRPLDLRNGPLLRACVLRLGRLDHVLLVTMHHIVSDGWSVGILAREFQALYMDGRLPPLPIQYADVAVWQQQWLTGPVLDRQLAYWRRQLDDLPLLELPTDRPRPPVPSGRGAMQTLALGPDLHAQLNTLSHKHGVTLFMTLLAAFQALMGRYADQADVVVGTSVANRNRLEVEELIGFFVNQLVFRTRLGAGMRVGELLRDVRETTLNAYANQDVEFGWLVEQLHPARDLSRSPLFQVTFALQNLVDRAAVPIPDLATEDFASAHTVAKQDLAVVLQERHGAGVLGSVEYAVDLFDATSIAALMAHFVRVLEAFVEHPDRPLDTIALLSASETRHLLAWNETVAIATGPSLVPALVAARAAADPDRVAASCERDSLSYATLYERARRLAGHLRHLGVGPDVCVAVFCERGLDLLVAVLGILEAGGAYVPLDPHAPTDRIAWQLDETHAPVVLTQEVLKPMLPATWIHVIALDAELAAMPALETAQPSGVCADHLAYVIYTSGSTGRPKGVGVTHGSLANLAHAQIPRFGLSAGSRVLQFAAFTFDAAASEWSTTLISGGTLVIARRDELMADTVSRLLADQQIDVVTLPPSIAALIHVPASLSTLVLAGEAVPPSLVRRWAGRCRVINAYGPTESTVCATMSAPLASDDLPVIGAPIDNVRAYAVDRCGELAPVNVPGELYVGGAGVARGYFGRPAQTAERFVPDPFGTEPGARRYRTGDRVRRLRSGALEYLGRVDTQLKLRGYRIEPGEIEAALLEHDGIAQAVVVAREDSVGDQQLVAYVVPRFPAGPQSYLLPNGLRVFHRTPLESDFLYAEIFEKRAYLQHGVSLTEDACVFDVGANIGMFTLLAGLLCPSGRVYAFEPIRASFERAEANAVLSRARVQLFEIGLSDREEDVAFAFCPRVSGLSGRADCVSEQTWRHSLAPYLRAQAAERLSGAQADGILDEVVRAEHVICRQRRLSDIIRETGVERIDLLKIDVEGAELKVLAGVDAADWDRIGQVVIEVHECDAPGERSRVDPVAELLHQRGFTVAVDRPLDVLDSALSMVYARRACAASAAPDAPVSLPSVPAAPGISEADLRSHLQHRLPAYMVPDACVLIPRLPLTSHGKIDHRALPAPHGDGATGTDLLDPRDTTEAHVRHIWEELLGRRGIGIREDFFQVGGHSLKAVALAATLSRVYDRELPVRLIFDYPTIESEAAYLRQQIAIAPPGGVVPLRLGGSEAALFCVPPAGGLVHPFVGLARYFDGVHPLYALQPPGLEDDSEPIRTIESMAARYIEEIRGLRRHGPYFLAGLSMGGAVAFEMARQLHAAGDVIGLVALLDPTPLRLPSELTTADWDAAFAEWEHGHLVDTAVEDLDASREAWRLLPIDERRRRYLEGAQRIGKIPADVTLEQFRRFLRVFGTNTLAVNRYRPAPYPGDNLVLFRTERIAGVDETYGWEQAAPGGITVREFPGQHGALIAEPLVPDLARQLQTYLATPLQTDVNGSQEHPS